MVKAKQMTAISVNVKDSDEPLLRVMRLTRPNMYRVLAAASVKPAPTLDNLAADLNIPKGTVKSRLNRSRAYLLEMRKAMEGVNGDEQAPSSTESI